MCFDIYTDTYTIGCGRKYTTKIFDVVSVIAWNFKAKFYMLSSYEYVQITLIGM